MNGVFSIKDLMINVVSKGRGAGTAGLFVETPPTPLTPITPVAAITAYHKRFKAIDKLLLDKNVDIAAIDRTALDVGRAVIGSRLTALCSMDMPTCRDNDRISPLASKFTDALMQADFKDILEQVDVASQGLQQAGKEIDSRILPELRKELGL